MYVVYLLKNSKDDKMYVGCTKNFHNRMYRHGLANEGYLIAKAIKKDGINSFEGYILDSSDNRKDALEKERKWTFDLNSMYPNGYNLRAGSAEWTQLVKSKMARHSDKRIKTDESILKCREAKRAKMKSIKCLETGVIYQSIAECCRELKINKGHLSYFFKGRTKSVKGFTFERTI